MEVGDIKEVIEYLDKADEVIRHRIGLNFTGGELHALEEARELVQKAVTRLLPYEKGG